MRSGSSFSSHGVNATLSARRVALMVADEVTSSAKIRGLKMYLFFENWKYRWL